MNLRSRGARWGTFLFLTAAVALPLGAGPIATAWADDAPAAAAPAAPAATAPAAPAAAAAPGAPAAAAPAAPALPDGMGLINTGDTAWMLTSMALVLMMTIPGLGLFYGGMVRKKNVLDTIMTSFAITALVTVIFAVLTYSLAFVGGGPFIGDLSRAFLQGIASDPSNIDKATGATIGSVNGLAGTIPETVYMAFQMTFAIITPALIAGAFAERMKFSAMLLFIGIWAIVVYAPVAHWVWGANGWLNKLGVLDFAGGTVVHINAGVAGLCCAIMLGKRKGLGTSHMAPHNLVLTIIGASLLWVGWFGFNAGSAVTANVQAGMAMTVTQLATAVAALTWMFLEWALRGKPTVLGICSGAVAGLVAITPASGFVGPVGSIVIGIAAGIFCYWGAMWLKGKIGYDDALDAFGVHAVGGIVGALLTGVFALKAYSAGSGWIDGNPGQVLIQIEGIVAVIVYDAVISLILLWIINMVVGLRVTGDEEEEGLDSALHGEVVQ